MERSRMGHMGMGFTIFLCAVMSAVLIYSFIYVTKKGYSRKWDEE
ncbi:hypothetical protein NYE48_18655 [Paenibacillus sp. FSL M7-1455]|nr:hypothetical protein CM49_00960 [Paenibacillus sp. P1XP2]